MLQCSIEWEQDQSIFLLPDLEYMIYDWRYLSRNNATYQIDVDQMYRGIQNLGSWLWIID